jgi:CRP/FNR family cyclic AMP-dependent transcriptional regulator
MSSPATELLRQVSLFAGISDTELQALAALTRDRAYPKGSVIVFADEPGDCMYVVASGAVKVVLIAEDGREVILSVLGPRSHFGEMALLDEERRSAHVIALEDTTLTVLRRDDFQRWLQGSHEGAIALLKESSRRLRRADEKIAGLVLLDVHGRVANILLQFADEEKGDRITRKLTHQTIAQLIGSSRETVSRTMRQLVNQEVISVTRQAIVLRDRRQLAEAARAH